MQNHLICSKCKKELDHSSFYRTKIGCGRTSWCKKCCNELNRKNKPKYKNSYKEKDKEWRSKNKGKIKQKSQQYYLLNRDDILRKQKEYESNSKEARNNRRRLHYKNNEVYRLKSYMRKTLNRMFHSLNEEKDSGTFQLLGYSVKELQAHLSKFLNTPCEQCKSIIITDTPRNYEIEHIIPVGSAECVDELLKLNKIENLRLLCVKCNKEKSHKDKEFINQKRRGR